MHFTYTSTKGLITFDYLVWQFLIVSYLPLQKNKKHFFFFFFHIFFLVNTKQKALSIYYALNRYTINFSTNKFREKTSGNSSRINILLLVTTNALRSEHTQRSLYPSNVTWSISQTIYFPTDRGEKHQSVAESSQSLNWVFFNDSMKKKIKVY